MDIFSEEYTKYKCIKNGYWDNFKVVGKGEAAALSYAIVNDGIIASNNLSDVKGYVKKFNIFVQEFSGFCKPEMNCTLKASYIFF
ncbi:hypothetical protein [Methanobrevibacter sp.]|uniref:hypothetical protein n=1 Tax=Methanobrevibacter sp. TaxID=66852 RepID=UPI00388F8EE5